MIRIDEHELAAHLDAALSTTPSHRIAQLGGNDSSERVMAIGALTSRLADRLRLSVSSDIEENHVVSNLPLFEHRHGTAG